MFFERKLYFEKLNTSLQNKKICFIIGARQIGKTTLLKKFIEKISNDKKNNAIFLSCDELAFKDFESAEELLQYFSLTKGINFSEITHLFLDEIQVVKNIKLFLKDLHDNYSFKIFASGSGSLKIFSGISESLIGRKDIIYMYPFSFREFLLSQNIPYIPLEKSTKTSIEIYQKHVQEFLKYGGYPEVLLQKTVSDKINILHSLYSSYSQQDILYYLERKEISSFQKFYAQITGSIGSLFKIDSFCIKLTISRKKVEEFTFLLQNTFLGIFLPPFVRDKAKEVRSHTKIFFSDTGFINSIWENFSLSPERMGLLVENFVMNEFQKNLPQNMKLFFWRKKSQTEIDFICKNINDGGLIPIEVKSGSTDNVPRAFKSFFEAYGEDVKYAVILNKDIYKVREYEGKKVFFIPYVYADMVCEL